MKSPELLEATASEPLSLQEEYEMQGEHLGDTIDYLADLLSESNLL
jgi:hypothetical protein